MSEPEINALKAALADWEDGPDDQSDNSPSAQGLHDQLIALNDEITRDRRQIQIAANQAFSHRKEINAQPRKDFHIPEHRPFV